MRIEDVAVEKGGGVARQDMRDPPEAPHAEERSSWSGTAVPRCSACGHVEHHRQRKHHDRRAEQRVSKHDGDLRSASQISGRHV